jgi:hypothetical protein
VLWQCSAQRGLRCIVLLVVLQVAGKQQLSPVRYCFNPLALLCLRRHDLIQCAALRCQVDTATMRPGEWERLRTGIALKTFTALMKRYQHMSAAEEAKKLREARRFAKVRPLCLQHSCSAASGCCNVHVGVVLRGCVRRFANVRRLCWCWSCLRQ